MYVHFTTSNSSWALKRLFLKNRSVVLPGAKEADEHVEGHPPQKQGP